MGACVSGDYSANIGRAELLVAVIKRVGRSFMIPMGIAVILACLTTAVGQIAAVADFFHTASNGKSQLQDIGCRNMYIIRIDCAFRR
ncbi:branched-chain amino acid transport system II carrier protein [Anaeroglobus geminatus]|nr:branched-chain amino acid transport system II carrier protein [Anaeroglobus geminatus]